VHPTLENRSSHRFKKTANAAGSQLRGLTLVELIVAFTIMAMLTAMAGAAGPL
jgi:prepilin-type N-terminal cleavage/methylation domain-containing protein